MIRKARALALPLIAVLAMSVAIPSQASGEALTTFPEGTAVVLSAAQTTTHKFVLTDHLIEGVPASTECTTAKFEGVGADEEGDTEVVLHPVYEGCKAFGLSAKFTTTGCDVVLSFGESIGEGQRHVATDIVCAPGAAIKIVTATCEVLVGPQTGLETASTTNSGGVGTAMDLVLHTALTGLNYTAAKDGIGCPLSGTGSFSKGDYTGSSTVTAKDGGGGAAGVTVH